MYFKRISDLHPASEYVLESLWVEASQSMARGPDDEFTPSHSNPKRTIDSDKTTQITSLEDLSTTSAFVSKKISLAEVFNSIVNISAEYADFSYITSYHIEGKNTSDNHRLCFNVPYTSGKPNPHISADTTLTATPITSNIRAVSALTDSKLSLLPYAAVTIEDSGLSAKQLHATHHFSVNYTGQSSGDVGTGVSANYSGITASNINVPGEAELTAARAYWADLAELYESDAAYPPGTLVCFGGKREITIASTEANAVVTENPAFLMNTALGKLDSSAQYPIGIALTGRSIVRVIGPVKKFDRLVLSKSNPGVACVKVDTAPPADDKVIGIALKSDLNQSEKRVEAVLKLTF